MTEPTNEELAEALRSIEGLPLGTQLIVRLAADRLSPPVFVPNCEDPDEDRWITWNGGECPVPLETVVEVKYRDGKNNVLYRMPNKERAGQYTWYDNRNDTDIIAYRIVGAP